MIQYKFLDWRTRVAIINLINALYHAIFDNDFKGYKRKKLWIDVLTKVYLQPVDYSHGTIYDEGTMFEIINETITTDEFDSVLTLFEFLLNKFEENDQFGKFPIKGSVNSLFKNEYVGYRYTNKIIVPITDDAEIESIEDAVLVPYQSVSNHLNKSLQLISDREHPDYANSIKESISAVEAICSVYIPKFLDSSTGEIEQ